MSTHGAPDYKDVINSTKQAERERPRAEREAKTRANGQRAEKHARSAECDAKSLADDGKNIAAVMDILQNFADWRGVLAFDRFSLRVMLMKPLPSTMPQTEATPRAMRDVDTTNALAWFHARGSTKLTPDRLHAAMIAVAQNSAYHPVLDFFKQVCAGAESAMSASTNVHLIDPDLPGTDVLSLWLTLGFGAADNVLNRAIARAFMISLVRRVRHPGCQQDHMLVLMSDEQGMHKSRGLRALVGDDWFADHHQGRLDPAARQNADRAAGGREPHRGRQSVPQLIG
jgi:putative DNA primase/helicase